MPKDTDFHTLKGYELLENREITSSMEDYLEMIARLSQKKESIRIKQLAEELHVKPSSASKMAGILKEHGFLQYERYGYLELTDTGRKLGGYLMMRHEVLHALLCWINHTDNELKEVEQIEHYLSPRTIDNIARLLRENGQSFDEKNDIE